MPKELVYDPNNILRGTHKDIPYFVVTTASGMWSSRAPFEGWVKVDDLDLTGVLDWVKAEETPPSLTQKLLKYDWMLNDPISQERKRASNQEVWVIVRMPEK